MPNQKHRPGSFPTIQLSRIAHNAMDELEVASRGIEAAVSARAIHAAYARLNRARHALALHLSRLEYTARQHGARGINPKVTVRYE